MHTSTIVLALALLPLGLAPSGPASQAGTPPQQPPAQGGTKPAPEGKKNTGLWPWGNTREAQRIEHEFCGVWQLFRMDLAGIQYLGSDVQGYLIAQPTYCSLVFRLVDRAEVERRIVFPGFGAGTYRWKYDAPRLQIVLETLLGADDLESETGDLRYERQGFSREYSIDLAGDEMTLQRGNESRLLFRRVPDAPRPPLPEPIDAREPASGRDTKEPRDGR
jgi:hypothetical protein